MKKLLFLLLVVAALSSMILASCGGPPAASPAPAPKPAPAPAPAPTAPAPAPKPAPAPAPTFAAPGATPTPAPAPKPGAAIAGGTLKIIAVSGPVALSYTPLMGPGDASAVFPAVERLVDVTNDRTLKSMEPVLAESVTEDIPGKKLVFKIRKGIKFHDGSDLNAEAVIWNYQLLIDAKRLWGQDTFFDKIVKVDDYTVELYFKQYTNQLVANWGWMAIFSKAAWDKNSGGDKEKGIAWARNNVVGTGPFMLKEYRRDDRMIWVKNPTYWRPGRPYLDGIEYRYIPDPVTANATMQAKQADYWMGAPIKMQADLVGVGFKRFTSWPGLPYAIWPNTADPASEWNKIELRQAVEYALDKETLASTMGRGFYKAQWQLSPSNEWGYIPTYPERKYSVAKAKEMLTKAGFPNGIKTKLLIQNDPISQDIGNLLKGYLDAAGISTELDVADPGRYFGAIYGTKPNPGLSWAFSGRDANYLQTYSRWFSTNPFTNLSYLGHTPEQEALDKKAWALTDEKAQEPVMAEINKYMTDNTRIVPVYDTPAASIGQPWVHSTQYTTGFVRWMMEEIWMDKH